VTAPGIHAAPPREGRPPTVRLVRTMGTVITLDVRGGEILEGPGPALDAAEAVLRNADAMFSTYRPDSWISRLARREVRPAQ
jgi:thiamine biosynthesis lipoprotein